MNTNLGADLNFDQYQMLFNSIDEGICIVEKVDTGHDEVIDFRYILTNPACERLTGLTNVIGKTIMEVAPNVNNDTLQAFNSVIQTGKPVKFATYEKAFERWLGVSAYPIDHPSHKRVVVTLNDITERKKIEEALHQSEARFRHLFSNNMIAMAIWNKSGEITDANEAFLDLLGYTKTELKGHVIRWTELTPSEYMERDLQAVAEVDEKGFCTPYEKCYRHKDGHLIPIIVGGGGFDDNTGTGVLYVIDLTERKQAEEELKESERVHAFHSTILESVRDPLWVTDSSLRIVYWNDAATAAFGWTADEAQGQHTGELFRTLVPDSTREAAVSQVRRKGDFFGEVVVHCKDGRPLIVEASSHAVHGPDGEVIHLVNTVRDITERKRTEQEIKESEARTTKAIIDERQRFLAMLETLPVMVCLIKPDYHIVFANRAFREKFGEPNGRHCYEYCYGYTEPCSFCEAFVPLRTGQLHNREFNSPDDKTIIDAHYLPFSDPKGSPQILEMYIDITERKRAEEALRKSNETLERSIEIKDEFLSLISHEFRTPLTVIISAIQMLKTFSWNELSDKAKGYFNTIRQNSNRQLKLVNNILDITKINAGSFEVHKTNSDIVALTRLIIESIEPYADRKKIRVLFSFDPAEIIIGIDEEKYERILLNLLSNAIKYTPKGEPITVKLSKKIVKNKAMACVQVCDNGIGIPADKQEHIFARFGQVDSSLSRQAEGTGIGLHLTRMFVEMLGGEIKINSKLGAGSTFTVLIPAIKLKETHSKMMMPEIADNRTIQLTEIEFSDIYFDK